MNKYNLFIQLLANNNNYQQVLQSGMFKKKSLDEYLQGTRKARPVTIMLIARVLGQNYQLYV